MRKSLSKTVALATALSGMMAPSVPATSSFFNPDRITRRKYKKVKSRRRMQARSRAKNR